MTSIPLARTGPFYDVVPIDPRYGSRLSQTTGVARRLAHGAGSALLMFAGADSLTADAAAIEAGSPPLVDFSSVEGIAQSIFAGGLTGPTQVLAALLIFMLAGKCVARFVGFLIVAAIVALHLQGVSLGDAGAFLSQLGERIASAVSAFQAADVN